MARYLLGRLAASVPTLVLLTLAAFLLSLAAKGDPALLALKAGGQDPTPGAIAAYREKLGLNDPLPVRYLTWYRAEIESLAPNTAYHYRVIASGLGGEATSEDATFTTAAEQEAEPVVEPTASTT